MDKSVPAGAALLLAFIYQTETGKTPPECYEVIYAHKQDRLPKPITHMTLDEVVAAQRNWSRHYGSSAAGAPQFIRKTLRGLIAELGLSGAEVFTPDMQDRLAYHLLKRRGYADFMAGRISKQAFAKQLAMEWASFPVLAPCRGAHRQLQRGQSYYAGDALNKALVSPETVEAVLARVKTTGTPTHAPEAPETAPNPPEHDNGAPAPAQGGFGGMIALALAGLAALVAGFWDQLTNFIGGLLP